MAHITRLTTLGFGVAILIASVSAAHAKGHDMGKADGSRTDPSSLRGGIVASVDLVGVGTDANGGFLGVVDAEHSLTFGQDVIQGQVADGSISVDPFVILKP